MEDRLERQLGNYQLTRLLGQGGFAEVYLAQHIYLKNQAAIKILLTRLSGVEMESFLHEARTVVNLIHPNIVRILEFGIEGNTPFLVMDYAPNGSLRQCYPKGLQLPLSLVATYIKQAASAIQYAHDQKLIHRDIKPENMLLGRNNELLISDFGIAAFAHSTLSQSTQQIVGTVAYMAPEQVQGKPRPASDQYALAIIAYEWLCGERPFHGNLTEIATQQIFTDPPPLHEKRPEIPPAVEQVIMTALAKDHRQRYSTILDFATELERASQSTSQPVQAMIDPNGPMLVKNNDSALAATPSSITSKEQIKANSLVEKIVEKRPVVGRIKKQQVLLVALGVLLYTLSSNFVLIIQIRNEFLWVLPALVIPIAFGILYGFWTGLVTGGLGYVLGAYISLLISPRTAPNSFFANHELLLPWYFLLGFISVGSIAGLATRVTKGRYRSIQNIAIAESFSIMSILISSFIVFNDLWPESYPYHGEPMLTYFIDVALPNMLLVLILLPIVLVIYTIFSAHKRHSVKH